MDEWQAPDSRLLLLSDASQAAGLENVFPDGLQQQLQDVFLTEVVRSSKRIVAGAAAFQLGVGGGNRDADGKQGEVKCHHESDGPPLRSHIFDIKHDRSGGDGGPGAAVDDRLFYRAYAHHTLEAMRGLVDSFETLDMHNRVAILVPDAVFLDALREELQPALKAAFPAPGGLDEESGRAGVGGRFELVTADRAAACIDSGEARYHPISVW